MIVLTGHAGGIGQVLASHLRSAGHAVCGIDRTPSADAVDEEIVFDLATLPAPAAAREFSAQLETKLKERPVAALINNAAWQCVRPIDALSAEELLSSFTINAIAPLLIYQALAERLRAGGRTLINITSVHASSTKAGFGAYAASKAALSSFSRTLALEAGAWLKVIELRPGAVATPMLEAGFQGRAADRALLDEFQPAGRISTPEEFAALCVQLLHTEGIILGGAVLTIDGGIGYRLHDPA